MYDERNEADGRKAPAAADQARNHPLRIKILALLAKAKQPMTAEQIRGKLPGEPTLTQLAYHMKALERAGLTALKGDGYELS